MVEGLEMHHDVILGLRAGLLLDPSHFEQQLGEMWTNCTSDHAVCKVLHACELLSSFMQHNPEKMLQGYDVFQPLTDIQQLQLVMNV